MIRSAIPVSPNKLRALAFAVVLIAFVLTACSSDAEESSATPEGPTTPIAGGREIPAGLIPTLDGIERLVVQMRGHAVEGDYTRELLPRSALRDFLEAELTTGDDAEAIAIEARLFKLLGLIDQDLDLTQAYRDLLGSQVVGLYNDKSNQLFVIEESVEGTGELSIVEEVTYAHEFFHLVQDDRFDLTVMQEAAEGNADRALALTAFIEGDATLVQTNYMTENISPFRLLGALGELTELLAAQPAAPYVLQQSLEFPYTEGMEFAVALGEGGFEGRQSAYADPPVSTEQIIHPEKYLARETPVDVDIPDVEDVLGDGWSEIESEVLGEFFLRTWLEALNTPPSADDAAAGWAGDNVVLLEGPNGEAALAIAIEWDRGIVDAEEFAYALSLGLARSREFERLTGDEMPAVWDGPGGTLALATNEDGKTCVSVAPNSDAANQLAENLGC